MKYVSPIGFACETSFDLAQGCQKELGLDLFMEDLVMNDYTPVSCDFHDEVEAIATLKQEAHIVYRDDTDAKAEVSGLIVDVYAKDGADYLKLENEQVIRMDRVESVNGKQMSLEC